MSAVRVLKQKNINFLKQNVRNFFMAKTLLLARAVFFISSPYYPSFLKVPGVKIAINKSYIS